MSKAIPIIRKILDYRSEGTVLDVGFGYSHHPLFLAERGFTVTAWDTDTDAVQQLAQTARDNNLSIDVAMGDVRELNAHDGMWDIVVCTFVLHFLQDEEVGTAVANLKAATQPGGLNVVAAHTTENTAEEYRKPHLFKPNELKERYSDWDILYYWYGLGKPFTSKRTGERAAKYRADLIARKPD